VLRNQCIAITAILFGSTGCLGALQRMQQPGPPPEIVTKTLSEETYPLTTTPESISVYTGKTELPRGFFFYQDRNGEGGTLRTKLYAMPSYPSKDAPHIVIAGMGTKKPVYSAQKPALLAEYKRRASEMGANALYVTGDSHPLAFAIVASDAAAPKSKKTFVDLANEERRKLSNYKKLGAPTSLALSDAQFSVDTKKARCYAMSIVFHGAGQLNDAAESALFVSLESGDRLMGNKSLAGPKEVIDNPDGLAIQAPTHGRFLHMRSFSSELGCAAGSAQAVLKLWTSGKTTAIGQGDATVQLFQRSISSGQLSQMLRQREQRLEEARIAAERQRRMDEARAAERERERAREREREHERQMASRQANTSRSSRPQATSSHFSMSLKNECRQTVKLFIGDKPKYGSGTSTSVSSNSINSYSGMGPKTYWIVDSSGNGLSSYTASPGSNSVRILPSCTGFARR
jgi:hypothetical protein